MKSEDPKREAARAYAVEAIEQWERSKENDLAAAYCRRLELYALGALSAVRPSKSLTIGGVRYKAVTSRGEVTVTRPKPKKERA